MLQISLCPDRLTMPFGTGILKLNKVDEGAIDFMKTLQCKLP